MDLINDIREFIKKVVNKEISFYKIEEEVGNANIAAVIRRKALEEILGTSLPAIGSTIIDFVEIYGRNIESPIGAIQIPLGIAGPLKINGDYAKGEYYIPLATTEGALVASVNRGCKALTLSGGVYTKIFFDGMTRAPLFSLPTIRDVYKFIKWINTNFDKIKSVAESITRHGRLLRMDPFVLGNNVWLRFIYTTGDAMGMNMVTIATDKACKYIISNYPGKIDYITLDGNLCVDKKPSALNLLYGRGKTVVAEAIVKREIIEEVLKTTPERIVDVNIRKNMLGSARSVSMAYNAHIANIVAAIFIATGQDLAQIVESSMGYTWAELRDRDLYISVTLPSLEVGTIGGGTWLPTQREALSILGVAGEGERPGDNAKKFAEIIASAVLAGELNSLAVLATRELARSHEELYRGKR